MATQKRPKTIEGLILERATLEKRLAELEEEEKKRQSEIRKKKDEVMSRALLKYFSSAEQREALQHILGKTLTKKGDRQLFGLDPLPPKKAGK